MTGSSGRRSRSVRARSRPLTPPGMTTSEDERQLRIALDEGQRRRAVVGPARVEAHVVQQVLRRLGDASVILDQQDAGRAGGGRRLCHNLTGHPGPASARGRNNVIAVPSPGALASTALPPLWL